MCLKIDHALSVRSLYQTFRLWVEEPRLHTAELYLPGLPPQYDANRLTAVFKAEQVGGGFPWGFPYCITYAYVMF